MHGRVDHTLDGRAAASARTACAAPRCARGWMAAAARLRPFCAVWICALLCALLWGLPGLAWAQTGVLPVPELTARVIDQTGTLSDTDKAALEAKLADYEKAKGSQIVVLMVPTTQPEDIAAYAHRVASTWKIGRRDVGDGVLLVVAKDDRRMRIEVARALEGALPDLAVARILDHTMKPQFRQNKYTQGIDAALDQIMRALDGENLAPVGQKTNMQDVDWVQMLVVFCIITWAYGSFLKAFLGRTWGALASGALSGWLVFDFSDMVLLAIGAGLASFCITFFLGLGAGNNSGGGSAGKGRRKRAPIIIGGSSSGGWGGSGGGFSSGGGGSFGGGGASGGW